MYKKGDVVKGLRSEAIYECMADELGERVQVRCIRSSPFTGNKVKVGYLATLPVNNIEFHVLPPATPAQTEKQETNDLIEIRRSLKQLFGL